MDPPREVPGAADAILHALDTYGLHWDGPVLYQSQRHAAYRSSIDDLLPSGAAFACACTRKQAQSGQQGLEGPIYPGTCRSGLPEGREARSVRLAVEAGATSFEDKIQGRVTQHLKDQIGDFVLQRADGYYAYQLAVVVDDGYQGVTEVVRGADLLASTNRQIYLQQCLGLPTPEYCHVPLALDEHGEKLSKRSHAMPLDLNRPGLGLHAALEFLGQSPAPEMAGASPQELLGWAMSYWQPASVPRQVRALPG